MLERLQICKCLRAEIQTDRLSNLLHSFMTLCVKIKIAQ